jgi:hypothetical protein
MPSIHRPDFCQICHRWQLNKCAAVCSLSLSNRCSFVVCQYYQRERAREREGRQCKPAWAFWALPGPTLVTMGLYQDRHGPTVVYMGLPGQAWTNQGRHGPNTTGMGLSWPAWAYQCRHGPVGVCMGLPGLTLLGLPDTCHGSHRYSSATMGLL